MTVFFRPFITALICLLLLSCSNENTDTSNQMKEPSIATTLTATQSQVPGCRSCHDLTLDRHHNLECSLCHKGNDQTSVKDQAHDGLISAPASPEQASNICGQCHAQTNTTLESSHFTAKNMVNIVRHHFGAQNDLTSADDIPVKNNPENLLDLADDLLRRNCLSCHITYSGDDYSSVRRGTGCAACHLEYKDGNLSSHNFIRKPRDQACLSCHYGNRVGSDYYGRFEHDFKHEYRTPYEIDGSYPPRPYGVEQHPLVPDVHQKAGLACIDCHPGTQLMGLSPGISCEGCHLWHNGEMLAGKNLAEESKGLVLTTSHEGQKLIVPSANNQLHKQYRSIADCHVCHAQWSFNDRSTHLLRMDVDNYDEWEDLIVQSNFETELLLSNSLYGDESYDPSMTDKITGQRRTGIWLKGYNIRRWEEPVIHKDSSGRLRVVRPLMDLVLSWVNSDEETAFDSVKGVKKVYMPYTPHTIGPAGAFYRLRINDMETINKPEKDPKK